MINGVNEDVPRGRFKNIESLSSELLYTVEDHARLGLCWRGSFQASILLGTLLLVRRCKRDPCKHQPWIYFLP